MGRTRVKDVTIIHLWEPRPNLGMLGALRFPFLSLLAPGRRECPDHLYHSVPEDQEEHSGSACAERGRRRHL